MKKILLAIVALTLTASAYAAGASAAEKGVAYDWTITRVVDGDTVEFDAPFLPEPLKKKLSVRIFGVDTPEKGFRAQCDKEKAAGEAASAYTKSLLKKSRTTQIILISWDKYGGRVLGDVVIDGQSLRALLIQNGYAREYYGDKKKSWCE
jgi:micrococcal nuclease